MGKQKVGDLGTVGCEKMRLSLLPSIKVNEQGPQAVARGRQHEQNDRELISCLAAVCRVEDGLVILSL